MKKKKSKINWQQILIVGLSMAVGVLCGMLIVEYTDSLVLEDDLLVNPFVSGGLAFVGMVVGIYMLTIIHEAGHLVFGLLSGYTFSSFRIGSFLWMKEDGKLKMKRYSLAGTGGQCLMAPPDRKNGTYPVVLYNLGGVIFNVISSIVFLLLYYGLRQIKMAALFCIILALIGILFAFTNGIPLQLGMINNDGYNALCLKKNKKAMDAFWLQLKVNEQISKGIRIKDMPEEWFQLPDPKDRNDSLVVAMAVFACNRMMDAGNLKEADATMKSLLEGETAMIGIHRNMLICDRMYCEMVGENRKEVIDAMYTKQQKKFMKSMKNNPSILRTELGYALKVEKDEKKVDKIKKQFEKCAKSYPYPGEIQSERELIDHLYTNNSKFSKK